MDDKLFSSNGNFSLVKVSNGRFDSSNGNELTKMSITKEEPSGADNTEIRFDLRSVCTPEEIEKFKAAAHEAKASSLTEHFINLTLRAPEEGRAA